MTTITIPANQTEMIERLTGIERLVTAKEWERAAILAAYVELPGSGGDRKSDQSGKIRFDRFTAKEFGRLGIAGLRTDKTITKYVRRWIETGRPIPQPGHRVNLNDLPPWKTEAEAVDQPAPKNRTPSPPDAGDVIRRQGADAIVSAMTSKQRAEVRNRLRTDEQRDAETFALEGKFHRTVEHDDIDAMREKVKARRAEAMQPMEDPRLAYLSGNVSQLFERTVALMKRIAYLWEDSDYDAREAASPWMDQLRIETQVLEFMITGIFPGLDES